MTMLRVLVAEDNEFNAQLLRQLLDTRGHQSQIASSDDEALRRVEDTEFDLLLLGLRMPGRGGFEVDGFEVDGLEVMERVRERRRATGKRLPVIALMARSREEDRERCFRAGINDVLTKPIDASALWAAIERVRPSEQEGNGPRDDGPFAAQWLDVRVLSRACGGDAVVLDRVVRSLRGHVPDELARAEAAWSANDATGLREAAHRLCGMIAAASTLIGKLASDLEDEAAAGRLPEAGVLLERLGPMTRALLSELEGASLERLLGRA
jgi:two-component system, sensor histidine kinase and response regulator